ncbi:MAG: MBL fold metallo-hydrolase [Anaerovoracaceae bacterium]
MKLAENIYRLDNTKGAYVYAVKENDGVTLIDSSLPNRAERIIKNLKEVGINAKDIKQILLTHYDIDHVGSAKELQKISGCKIYISHEDYPHLVQEKKGHGIKLFGHGLIKKARPENILPLIDNKIGNFEAIKTPGHTDGHTVYKYKDFLFVGDLFTSKRGILRLSPFIFIKDRILTRKSIFNLPVLGIKKLCPAHGIPVQPDMKWLKFARKYLSISNLA